MICVSWTFAISFISWFITFCYWPYLELELDSLLQQLPSNNNILQSFCFEYFFVKFLEFQSMQKYNWVQSFSFYIFLVKWHIHKTGFKSFMNWHFGVWSMNRFSIWFSIQRISIGICFTLGRIEWKWNLKFQTHTNVGVEFRGGRKYYCSWIISSLQFKSLKI